MNQLAGLGRFGLFCFVPKINLAKVRNGALPFMNVKSKIMAQPVSVFAHFKDNGQHKNNNMLEIGMTEVLFTASVAFAGYVIYVLVDEQMSPAKHYRVDVQNESPAKFVKLPISKTTRTQTKSNKARIKEKRAATIILNLAESVGMAAGSIWRYLNEKGPTAIAKLVKELPESNKTLQRSIGWLAQEGKITLETIGGVETIALKD